MGKFLTVAMGKIMVGGVRIITLVVLWLVIGSLLYSALAWAWGPVWLRWGVPSMLPSFFDLRSITAGLETMRHGGDPLVANPYDRLARPVNYPRLWLYLFSALHINDNNVVVVGVIFCVLYLICVSALILRSKSGIEAAVLLAAGLSLAPLLAIERGTTDLFVFATIFLGAVTRRESLKLGSYSLAALLKIFPLVALAVHAFLRPAKQRIASVAVLLTIVAIFLFQWRDIIAIRRGTPADAGLSYGILSLQTQALWINGQLAGTVVFLGSWMIIVFIACRAWMRAAKVDSRFLSSHGGEIFLTFIAIYLFSFLAGSNYIYRLIFLLPTLPFAFEMIRCRWRPLLGWIYIGLVVFAENVCRLRYGSMQLDVATFALAIIAVTMLTEQVKYLVSTRAAATAPQQEMSYV